MRSDNQIERDVIDELADDSEVDKAPLTVQVSAGIVRLGGSAPTYAARLAARRAVERVGGVRAICDDMIVSPPPELRRSDAVIARNVGLALDLNVQVPRDAIGFNVVGGHVTLSGIVSRHADRAAAEESVAVLAGVRDIVNQIRVEASAPSGSVVVGIERALHRSAELDCKHILIDADADGEVSLRGTVRSWAEHHDAERAAWSTAGVRNVTNRLIVVL